MPEALSLALQTPGLVWVLLAAFLAGTVYGFAGFGSALVFVPMAVAFVPPLVVVPAFHLSAIMSLFTVFPRAVRVAEPRTTAVLVITSTLAAPLGIYLLTSLPEEVLRWAVSIIVGLTLVALLSGWRYTTAAGMLATGVVGFAAGTMGSSTGLNGPIVIMFRLGGTDTATQIRANMLVFLTLNSLFVVPVMAVQGALSGAAFWLGLVLLIPYGLGTLLGQALFRPAWQGIYRRVAYALIGVSVIVGLPIW
jgi:uncharacterized membrane protein YfcA